MCLRSRLYISEPLIMSQFLHSSQNFDFAFLAIFTNPTRLFEMAAIHKVDGLKTFKGLHYGV